MSGGNALFITLHYAVNIAYTCQEANLCLSLYYTVEVVYTCQELILFYHHTLH